MSEYDESKIVKKPIYLASPLPVYWFGDKLTVGFQNEKTLCLKAVVTGIRYCHAEASWMYCFELGDLPSSGIIWFSEWEVEEFQSDYEVKPIESGYPNQDTNSDDNDDWSKIPF